MQAETQQVLDATTEVRVPTHDEIVERLQRIEAKQDALAAAVLGIGESVRKFDELAEALNGSSVAKMFGLGG